MEYNTFRVMKYTVMKYIKLNLALVVTTAWLGIETFINKQLDICSIFKMTTQKINPRIITNSTDEGLTSLLKATTTSEVITSSTEELVARAAQDCHVVMVDYSSLDEELQKDDKLMEFLRELHKANGMKTVLLGYNNHEVIGRLYKANFIVDAVDRSQYTSLPLLQIKVGNAYRLFLMEHDDLTKLFNRSYLEYRLSEAVEKAKETLAPISVSIYDLDYFKKINDEHGHGSGDKALQTLAAVLKDSCKKKERDVPGRWGGDEFLVVSTQTYEHGACQIAQRVMTGIKKAAALIGKYSSLSVSGGLATYDGFDPLISVEKLVDMADQRLYRAKQDGRNRVYGSEHVPSSELQDCKHKLL